MRFLAITLTVFTVVAGYSYVRAQTVPFVGLTTEDGLSHNFVQAITQDEEGFLWVGTRSGLNRFDGYDFVAYLNDSEDPGSLSSNTICAILADGSNIWVGASNGLNLLEKSSGRIRRILSENQNETLQSCSLLRDQEGTIWFGTNNGLFHVRDDSIAVKEENWGSGAVSSLDLDQSGRIVGISRDPSGVQLIRRDSTGSSSHTRLSIDVRTLAVDHSNTLWLAGEELYRWDETSSLPETTIPALELGHSFDLSLGPDSSIWIASTSGSIRVDPINEQKRKVFNIDNKAVYNLTDEVYASHLDASGLLWLGTASGLYRTSLEGISFLNDRFPGDLEAVTLPHSMIMSILEDASGNRWISSYAHGVVRIEKNGRQSIFRNNPSDPSTICGNVIWNMAAQGDTVWFSTDTGVCRYQSNTFELISPAAARFVFLDQNDTVWRAGYGSICSVESKAADSTCIPAPHIAQASPEVIAVEGDTMFTAGRGFFSIHSISEESSEMVPLTGADLSVAGSDIWALELDEANVWIGGENGLYQFDRRTRKISHLNKSLGLDSHVIYSIAVLNQRDEHSLWLGTSKGITRVDLLDNSTRHFDRFDGIQSSEFNRRAVSKLPNSWLAFGGIDGFTTFNPLAYSTLSESPPIIITQIIASKRSGSTAIPPSQLHELVLSYDNYTLSFEFAALDYRNPGRNRYAYRLEGFDEQWIDSGSRRFITYTNIPPGDYELQIKSSRHTAVQASNLRSLRVRITPPWWQTWWARCIFGLVFLGGISLLYRVQMGRILDRRHVQDLAEEKRRSEEEAIRLAELDESKNRFFANLSHEFRTPLTLISSPILDALENGDISQETRLREERILRQSNHLLSLINQLLDLSKLEAGKLSLKSSPQDLVKLVTDRVSRFYPLAERKGIAVEHAAPAAIHLGYFDPVHMASVIDNLLSNAFKFTPRDGKVTIEQGMTDDIIEVTISDSGPGIDPEDHEMIFDRFVQLHDVHTKNEGTGIGLSFAREITLLHKGSIIVDSEVGRGSSFRVQLPRLREGAVTHSPTTVDSLQPNKEEKPQPTHLQKILIVEDHPEVRELIRCQLEKSYVIFEAENGLEGLEMAKIHMPDLIVSDVMMPEMDGFEFCRAVKEHEKLRLTPVILLTARADLASSIKGYEKGADDYISKPYNPEELRARIANRLVSRRHYTQLRKQVVTGSLDSQLMVSEDGRFLSRLVAELEDRLENSLLGVDELADILGMGRRSLERNIRSIVGQSPAAFIRDFRLERAWHLLNGQTGSVSEIAYKVGFKSPGHFSRRFKEKFGQTPSDLISESAAKKGGAN